MPDIDYANQIANLIKELTPYSSLDIGNSFQATNVEISGGKVFLEFDSENYEYLKSLITDADNPYTQFTISGFNIKNNLLSFSAYPESSTLQFGFLAEFSYPHKLKIDQEITLKGFTDTDYSIAYRVIKVIDNFFAVLYPLTTVSVVDIESGLGYLPVQYTSGMNGLQTLSDEDSFTLSYEIDTDEYLVVSNIDDVDTDFDVYLHDYNSNVKVIDLQTFLANLTDPTTESYLIVDTTSLIGTQNRSRSNNQDNGYSSYGRVGFFEKNYSITLHYFLERNTDDSSNQTSSGSDIVKKQVEMHDALLSILRESLEDESGNKIFTALTILSDGQPVTVSEGRFRIPYVLGFSVFYNSDLLIEKDDKNSYKIDFVKINNDVVDFS